MGGDVRGGGGRVLLDVRVLLVACVGTELVGLYDSVCGVRVEGWGGVGRSLE